MNMQNRPLVLIGGTLGALALVYVLRMGTPADPDLGLLQPEDTVPVAGGLVPVTRPPVAPKSQVVLLYDVSESFHASDPAQSAMVESIPILRSSVETIGEHSYLPGPVRYVVGTVADVGLQQKPLCTVTGGTVQSVFSANDSASLSKELDQCETALHTVKPSAHTDIGGAVMFASYVLHGRSRQPRGLVVVSDLADDPPPDVTAAVPDLNGVCVGLVLALNSASAGARNPALVQENLKQWIDNLREWGAKDVVYWHLAGFQPSELGAFLQECGARQDGRDSR